KHAEHVARNLDPVAKSVRIVELPGLPLKGDVSDWLKSDTAGAKLSKLAKAAPLWEPSADKADGSIASDERSIIELAGLSRLQYAKRRKDAAEAIGIGVGELDKIVAEARGDGEDTGCGATLYDHWNVEAASEPVDSGILLRALKEAIQRYVFMSGDQAVAVTLWIVFSWLHETVTHSPILYVTSAGEDNGKSTVLGGVNFVARPSLERARSTDPALHPEAAADIDRRRGRRRARRQSRSPQRDQQRMDARPGRRPLSPRHPRTGIIQHVRAQGRRDEGPQAAGRDAEPFDRHHHEAATRQRSERACGGLQPLRQRDVRPLALSGDALGGR